MFFLLVLFSCLRYFRFCVFCLPLLAAYHSSLVARCLLNFVARCSSPCLSIVLCLPGASRLHRPPRCFCSLSLSPCFSLSLFLSTALRVPPAVTRSPPYYCWPKVTQRPTLAPPPLDPPNPRPFRP